VKVNYVGPHLAVEVETSPGVWKQAERDGAPIEVSDELGASLLEQESNWKAEAPAKADNPKAEAPTAAPASTPKEG
jgi:hypothetical protein